MRKNAQPPYVGSRENGCFNAMRMHLIKMMKMYLVKTIKMY